MKKIYRGLDYHKGRLILLLGIIILILSMCKPEYNDVQFKEVKSDTLKDGN